LCAKEFSRPVFWLGVVIGIGETLAAIYFVRRTVDYRGPYPKLRAILLCLPTAQPLLLLVNGVDKVPPVIVFGLVLGMLVTIWIYLMTSFVQDGRKDRDRAIRDAAFRADYKAR
jgi:hypothetical protein